MPLQGALAPEEIKRCDETAVSMNELERGVMLLCCNFLGQEGISPLTAAQFKDSWNVWVKDAALLVIGMLLQSRRFYISGKDLGRYLIGAKRLGLEAMTRVSCQYPTRLRQTLGDGCPAVLFFAGNLKLLQTKMISIGRISENSAQQCKICRKGGIRRQRRAILWFQRD